MMGVNQSTISQLEAMTNDPQMATLQRYAQALGMSLRLTLEETTVGKYEREKRERAKEQAGGHAS
jgi:transcriptional regulator with XRE-family HTH domain